MSNNMHPYGTGGFDPALIEAAMQRGRQERSKAFWSMLQWIFGRPEARADDHPVVSNKGAAAHC